MVFSSLLSLKMAVRKFPVKLRKIPCSEGIRTAPEIEADLGSRPLVWTFPVIRCLQNAEGPFAALAVRG